MAMYPKVFTVARRMAFFAAFSSSSSSKQMRIHSRGDTMSAPRSAMRPTRSMQFSCTFSCRFFRMGVNLGSRSLIGGCMFVIPMTFTMDFKPDSRLPSTSGYSSPRHSYSTVPRWPSFCSSPHVFMTTAMRAIRSAACMRTFALRLFNRHLIVPQICGRYGLTRRPNALTTTPKPEMMELPSSPVCSWNAYKMPSFKASSRRLSTSDAPRFRMIFSMADMAI